MYNVHRQAELDDSAVHSNYRFTLRANTRQALVISAIRKRSLRNILSHPLSAIQRALSHACIRAARPGSQRHPLDSLPPGARCKCHQTVSRVPPKSIVFRL